jgi:hypothetical protein
MKPIQKFLHWTTTLVIFILITAFSQNSYATARSAAASGNWSATSTWSGGVVPVAGDAVTIDGGFTVTVDVTGAACTSIQIGSTTTGTLTFSGTSDLTVSGAITAGGSSAAGTITMISTATLTTGSLAAGTTSPTFTLNAGTIIFTGSFTLPSGANSFNNLTINSGGNVTIGSSITASGTITVNGTLQPNSTANAYTVGGTLTGTGSIWVNVTNQPDDLTYTYTGSLTLTNMTVNFNGSGGTPSITSSLTCANLHCWNGFGFSTSGNITITVSGTITTDYNFVPSSGTIINGAITGGSNGGIIVTATGNTNDLTAQYTGSINYSTLVIQYGGTAAQALNTSISPKGFIIANTSSTVTFNANETPGASGTVVNNNATLVVSSGNTLSGALSGNSGGTIKVMATGNTNDLTAQYTGTLTLSSLTINFAGTALQAINATISPKGFVISNTSSTVSFNASETPGSGGTTVNASATLIVSASSTLSGNLTGNGTIEVTVTGNTNDLTAQYTGTLTLTNLTVLFAGSGTSQNIPTGTYKTLMVNNSSGTTLTGSVTLSTGLTFSSGKLVLGNNNLTLNSGVSISGASSSAYIQITGTGSIIAKGVTSLVVPVGDEYAPVTIASGGGADYTISLVNSVTASGGSPSVSNHAVGITWTITASTAQTPTLTFQWPSGNELASFTRSSSYVAQRTSPSGTWAPLASPSAAGGIDPYTQSATATSMTGGTAYDFAIGDNGSTALPVTLTAFNATYNSGIVSLNWTTASEINNSHFEIERSVNGQSWNRIGNVEGHGNSLVTNNYAAIDNLQGMIHAGNIYYRLKQVDFNGVFTYSDIRTVNTNDAQAALSTFPNPASNVLNVQWNSKSNGNAVLRIMNINGVTVYTETVSGSGAMNRQVDMSVYPAGTYYVQVITADNTSSKTLIVNR